MSGTLCGFCFTYLLNVCTDMYNMCKHVHVITTSKQTDKYLSVFVWYSYFKEKYP